MSKAQSKKKSGKKVKAVPTPLLVAVQPMTEVLIHPQLIKCVTYGMYKIAMKMRFLIDQALQEYGLITPAYGILKLLVHEDLMNQATIGAYTNMDKASMVKMIDYLEKRKYVRRISDAKDRRNKLVQITNSGRKMAEKASAKREELEKQLLSGLSEQESTQLSSILKKLTETILQKD